MSYEAKLNQLKELVDSTIGIGKESNEVRVQYLLSLNNDLQNSKISAKEAYFQLLSKCILREEQPAIWVDLTKLLKITEKEEYLFATWFYEFHSVAQSLKVKTLKEQVFSNAISIKEANRLLAKSFYDEAEETKVEPLRVRLRYKLIGYLTGTSTKKEIEQEIKRISDVLPGYPIGLRILDFLFYKMIEGKGEIETSNTFIDKVMELCAYQHYPNNQVTIKIEQNTYKLPIKSNLDLNLKLYSFTLAMEEIYKVTNDDDQKNALKKILTDIKDLNEEVRELQATCKLLNQAPRYKLNSFQTKYCQVMLASKKEEILRKMEALKNTMSETGKMFPPLMSGVWQKVLAIGLLIVAVVSFILANPLVGVLASAGSYSLFALSPKTIIPSQAFKKGAAIVDTCVDVDEMKEERLIAIGGK